MSTPLTTADLSTTSNDGHLEDTAGLLRLSPTWVPRLGRLTRTSVLR